MKLNFLMQCGAAAMIAAELNTLTFMCLRPRRSAHCFLAAAAVLMITGFVCICHVSVVYGWDY